MWSAGMALVLLAGCATSRDYHAERRAYREQRLSDYYRHEIVSTPSKTVGEDTDTFAAAVEKHLLQFQREWEKKVKDEPVTAGTILPLTAEVIERYGKLAADDKLDATLKDGIDLPQLLGLAYSRNPKLKAARAKLKATLQKYPQAAALDDILHQYNAFTKQLDTKVGPKQHKDMVAMKFPFPDMLAVKGKIVNEEVAIAQQNYEIALRDLVAAVRKNYYAYVYTIAALEITKENQVLLQQVVKVAQQKYQVDQGKYGHVIMGQVELSKLSDRVLTIENRRGTIAAKINALLNRRTEAPLGAPQPLTDQQVQAALPDLYKTALHQRQEVRRQALAVNRMDLMITMASRMTYPDASLGASYLETGMRRDPQFMPKRTLNERQTAWVGQRDAYVREMKHNLVGMQQKLKAVKDQTRFAVKKQYLALDTTKRSIALYRKSLLPQAKQAVKAAQTAYANNKMDFVGFVDAQRTLLNVQLGEQQALRDYRAALAELERLVGRALNKEALTLPKTIRKDSD